MQSGGYVPGKKILLYEPNEILRGRKEIMAFLKVSRWSVVKEWIDLGMPVTKVGRSWASTKRLILDWVETQIINQVKLGLRNVSKK